MKLQSKHITFILTSLIFSCMEPLLEKDEDNSEYQIQNYKEGYLNLDFEDGIDFWEFNSSRIYATLSNSISIEKTSEIVGSGSSALGIKAKNQRLFVNRTIEYLPGDSINFSINN